MSWDVVIHPDATTELDALAPSEQASVLHAIEKLIAPRSATRLPPPKSRRGRAFYRQLERTFVIASIGPEVGVDRRGFERAVESAGDRLAALES
jgi:mRNA-degrading endonuclease RelE of RelBE toxin-antitoxin system